MLSDFYPYAKEYLGFDKDASINFASDNKNANDPLGKTAYYDPSNYSVTIYTDNRHPKDIMRSVAHELVHHAQNCSGELSMSEDTGEGYAQNNQHLRDMETDAYKRGNLCFRDWEDGVKSNLAPGTTYEHKSINFRRDRSMNNFKTITENFQSFLRNEGENDTFSEGDKVKDLRNDSVGTVVEPMAGGAIVELEDGSLVKIRSKFLERADSEPMQEGGTMGEYGKIDAEDGNPPSKIGRGNEEYMAAYNAVLQARGEEPLDIQQPDAAYLDALRSGQLEEGFRDSDEEKDMMAKMSNKELYKYLTRDRHTVPDLKGDMGPMDGMEGPFQFRSGAVLYYDPKAGKYYDRGKDMYLDNEEASELTMENDTMESNNTTSLREKVKTAVMSKLSEMFDDDDMYGDEDPYMAGLEAEFPWLKGKDSAAGDEDAAMAAAARDAAMSGEFQSDEEEMEEPTVMNETYDDEVYDKADKVVDALGYTDTLDNLYKAMDRREFLGNLEYISRMNDIDIPEDAEDDRWNVYDMVREAMGDEQFLQATLQAMSTEDATQTLDFIMTNYGIGEGDEDMYETTLRDRVMKRVQEVIGQTADTEESTETVVSEDASDETFAMLDTLTSGLSEREALEAVIQALDVDTARGTLEALIRDYDLGAGAEEMDEAKGEYDDGDGKDEKCDYVDCEDKEEVKEETVVNEETEEEVEEVEEAIANNPEDFYRQLRSESRVVNRPDWNGTAKNKRSSVLNERLMKAWFNK